MKESLVHGLCMTEEQESTGPGTVMGSVGWRPSTGPSLSLLGLPRQPEAAVTYALRQPLPQFQSACSHTRQEWQLTQRIRGNAETCMSCHSHLCCSMLI